MADKTLDTGKLEVLLRLQREVVSEEKRALFDAAMFAAQSEMAPIVRDATNDQTNSRYARLETIDAAIRPIYSRHGFHLSFNGDEQAAGDGIRIVCDVIHRGGHTRIYRLPSELDTAGPRGGANKTPLHGLGSAITYLRRYLTVMIFNLVLRNEDTDGNRPPADDGVLLDRQQVAELTKLMKETGTFEDPFLKYHTLGQYGSIRAVPGREFGRLRASLLSKASVLAARAKRNGASS
jgi:hypothetical protein